MTAATELVELCGGPLDGCKVYVPEGRDYFTQLVQGPLGFKWQVYSRVTLTTSSGLPKFSYQGSDPR
jgi:hypothetical protein